VIPGDLSYLGMRAVDTLIGEGFGRVAVDDSKRQALVPGRHLLATVKVEESDILDQPPRGPREHLGYGSGRGCFGDDHGDIAKHSWKPGKGSRLAYTRTEVALK
jgi:hypothetical protein